MNAQDAKIGQVVRGNPSPDVWQGVIVCIDWSQLNGSDRYAKFVRIQTIKGVGPYPEFFWESAERLQGYTLLKDAGPLEDAKPTTLKPSFGYMKDLGL